MGKATDVALRRQLTDQQEMFCREYVARGCKDATKAALAAGYSARSAASLASQLLKKPKLQARVQALVAESAQRLEIDADRVLAELARVAFGRMDHVATWGPDGISLLPFDEVPEADRAAVAQALQTVTNSGGTIRIKMHDKVAALDILMRCLGGYESARGTADPRRAALSAMSTEELVARAEELRSARLAGRR